MQKGQNLWYRTRFALAGLGHAFARERSFRTQCLAAVIAMSITFWLQPGWLWAGLIATVIALALGFELLNTALEHALDGLHPEQAEFVGIAKDCAAAAVLMICLLAVLLFVFMLLDRYPSVLR